VYVLGDSQFLYALLDSEPYWMISVYDSSPVREQREVIDRLDDDLPDVVVLDRRDTSFDIAPNVLRIPLLYRWVIDHYAIESQSGPYDLLTPRDAAIDWEHWSTTLGGALDLGRLPAAVPSRSDDCVGEDAASCLTYLTIDVEPVEEPTPRSIEISATSGTYTLTLVQWEDDETLIIPLERLWFWPEDDRIDVSPVDWATTDLIQVDNGDFLY
jgi:hypothetical protein